MRKSIFILPMIFLLSTSVFPQELRMKLYTDEISLLNNVTKEITTLKKDINIVISNHAISVNGEDPVTMISEPVLIDGDKNNFYAYGSINGLLCRCWFKETDNSVLIIIEFDDYSFIYNCIIVE